MRGAWVIVAVWAALACGPIDQSGSSSAAASDGGAAAVDVDAGASTDGGVIVVSGGTADGGAPDAGTTSGGGTADAGSPATTCAAIVPEAPGPGHGVALAHGEGQVCWYFTSDRSGNVAGEAHGGSQGADIAATWQIFSPDGAPRGSVSGVSSDFIGQTEGFESTQHDGHSALSLFAPDGRSVRSTPLDQGHCSAQALPSAVGGSLVLDFCGGALSAWRFDGKGNALVSVQLGRISGATGAVDKQGKTLLLFTPGSAVGVASDHAARWYDAQLAPLTPFFAAPGAGDRVSVSPLIGGGAAVQVNGVWTGVAGSGQAGFDKPPAWLAAHRNFDLEIIRAGTGYACIPRAGASPHNALDLLSSSGESCGSLIFPTAGLSVGPDGTVIGTSGEGGCTMTWWSGLLK